MSFLLAAALLAPGLPVEAPKAFVERLYAGYRDPDFNPLAHPRRIFAPPLVAAIREDARLSRGEVGYMDADPLCQCQDSAGLRATIDEVGRTGATAATARVLVDFGGSDRRDLTLRLVRTPAGWRVADIATADDLSLLESLNRFNRRRAAR
ncbi:MAG: hypothetical protein QOJ91_379 [Sphingomonadales bacterium]|jgi:hypothetical protein|nr:hypothetical protein [Sphingomonadales bacterium]